MTYADKHITFASEEVETMLQANCDGGYAAFGSGDMEALVKLDHPECKTTFHANHALGGEYIGFDDFG